ncbi:MAG: DNA topoisomerase IB [Pseudomonadota bacterium]
MPRHTLVARLATEKGLTLVGPDALRMQRRRCGRGFLFLDAEGRPVRDPVEMARLKALAVPPAYSNVRYAADPRAHLQAIGEDAAGRLQYRYHPKWAEVREALKARRLAGLAKALPAIRRAVARCMSASPSDRRFVAACVVDLVSLTAIRAGSEEYARERGTRGATTLLKSNVALCRNGIVRITFRGKGGKVVTKEVKSRRFHSAVRDLLAVPGRRLFQWRDEDGEARPVRADDVNAFLHDVAGARISLKDFRTLVASAAALRALAATEPASSQKERRRQVRAVVEEVAQTLANTPTVCRTSYVHGAVVAAFEAGALKGRKVGRPGSPVGEAEVLARIVSSASRAGRTMPK